MLDNVGYGVFVGVDVAVEVGIRVFVSDGISVGILRSMMVDDGLKSGVDITFGARVDGWQLAVANIIATYRISLMEIFILTEPSSLPSSEYFGRNLFPV